MPADFLVAMGIVPGAMVSVSIKSGVYPHEFTGVVEKLYPDPLVPDGKYPNFWHRYALIRNEKGLTTTLHALDIRCGNAAFKVLKAPNEENSCRSNHKNSFWIRDGVTVREKEIRNALESSGRFVYKILNIYLVNDHELGECLAVECAAGKVGHILDRETGKKTLPFPVKEVYFFSFDEAGKIRLLRSYLDVPPEVIGSGWDTSDDIEDAIKEVFSES